MIKETELYYHKIVSKYIRQILTNEENLKICHRKWNKLLSERDQVDKYFRKDM